MAETHKSFDVEQSQRALVVESHHELQLVVLRFAVPIAGAIFGARVLIDPCWHNTVMLVGFLAAALAWVGALHLTRRGALDGSVLVFVVSMILLQALSLALFDGGAATSLLGDAIVIIYASLFSMRMLLIAAGATYATFTLAEVARALHLFAPKVFGTGERLAFLLGFGALLLAITVILLRRSRTITGRLEGTAQRMYREQANVIETANEVGAALDEVVQRIRETTDSFAAQASQQAVAIRQITATMVQVRRLAGETSSSADRTRSAAEQARSKSKESAGRLREMEAGFEVLVRMNEEARAEFAELAVQAESIEEILIANREIAAQIKILAINAGIQAAKAGRAGAGFRVVAGELKEMILKTEESLGRSRVLLEQIRERSRRSAETIQRSAILLRKQVSEVLATGTLVEEITTSFVEAAEKVKQITVDARNQETRLDEVGGGLDQIDIAATHLDRSSVELLDSVEKIVASQQSLRAILASDRT